MSDNHIQPAWATATVQDIHLELIRRTQYNFFEGQQVLADLLAHRADWQAVMLDSSNLAGGGCFGGLIKLRDLADNIYNVDTLYMLAVNEAAAQRLANFAEEWQADDVQIYDQNATNERLGNSDDAMRLVTMWWD